MPRPLVLLSDFGLDDPYVGVVEAAMAAIAPSARCIHLTHAVPPQDVRGGSFALAYALPWLPPEAVVWAVVDPGVGTDRRPVAVDGRVRHGESGQRITLVAPDNGLLTEALARMDVWAAVVLDDPRYHGAASSATFHGRDVFGPAAAWLAHGEPFASLGSASDPAGLIRLDLPAPQRAHGAWRGTVRWVDRFGNLVTDLPGDLVAGGAWVATVHPESPDGLAEATGAPRPPRVAAMARAAFRSAVRSARSSPDMRWPTLVLGERSKSPFATAARPYASGPARAP